eukprot:3767674-Prymnesium_polylepis.1
MPIGALALCAQAGQHRALQLEPQLSRLRRTLLPQAERDVRRLHVVLVREGPQLRQRKEHQRRPLVVRVGLVDCARCVAACTHHPAVRTS